MVMAAYSWVGGGSLERLRRPSPGRGTEEGRGPSTTLSQALRSWLGSAQDDMGWGCFASTTASRSHGSADIADDENHSRSQGRDIPVVFL
jgi:hypothetical protein